VSILLNGHSYKIPGVTSVLCAQTTFRRPRVHPVQFIVLHSTGDAAVQGVVPGSLAPTRPLAWCDADMRESAAHTASWDATIRSDGVLLWNNDPVKYEDYHATNLNPRSMGIELAQSGPNGEIYQAQIDSLVKVLDFLTAYFGIQRQIPWRNGAPDRRVMTRFTTGDGADYSGIIAHRNGDDNRSDPGDGIIRALHAAGYEGFDLVAGEDKAAWRGRQQVFGVPQTGWGDAATRAALLERGYPSGVWVKRGGSAATYGLLAVAGLLVVSAGAWWLATRGMPRKNPDDDEPERRCVVCNVLWHPSTGMLVGHPTQHAFCGRHARESIATMKWATSRRPKKGQPDFYEAAGRKADEVKKNPSTGASLLFSYGSNTPAQLAERLGRPVETGGAFLPGYVRVFRGMSQRWGGGVASLDPQSGGVTYGLVSPVSAADLARMDQFEGVASGSYARKNVKVMLADGTKRDAVAYVSRSAEFNAPSRKYLEAVAKTVDAHWKEGGRRVTWKDIDVRENPRGRQFEVGNTVRDVDTAAAGRVIDVYDKNVNGKNVLTYLVEWELGTAETTAKTAWKKLLLE